MIGTHPVLTRSTVEREVIRRQGLRAYVRRAWAQTDASPLVWGFHLDAVCEHLEALYRREIRDLVINLPPGMTKSQTASVLFPTWVWTLDPAHKFIVASYAEKILLRDARKARTLVEGDWYRARWPEVQIPRDATASAAVGMYFTTAGGMRYSATVRGPVTGQHADVHLVDDPIDPMGAASSAEMDLTLEWWTGTMPTRVRDHRTIVRLLIMQRLHEADLTREFKRAGATVLCLPMRHDPTHPDRWPRDPRTQPGELLCPARAPEEAVARMERTLGPSRTAAQLQQRPTPAGGGVFRAEWFRRWTELPPRGTWSMSVDCTFKVTTDGSFVVIQVWYQAGPNFYLVDQRRERLSFTETVAAILAMLVQYPSVGKKLIEGKANGSAVLDALRAKVSGLIEIEPEGGKEARANGAQPLVAGGNVYLPDETHAVYADGRRGAPWVPVFVHECTSFPKGETDDQVDAMTQMLNAAGGSFATRLQSAMGKI